ncbi:MAG: hypothetical protein EA398_16060 [Deltaproteobacteria bacterium]|nr:MAG: hypothetical protein EA398_16060 [Deltaproteobacteria bacterium]
MSALALLLLELRRRPGATAITLAALLLLFSLAGLLLRVADIQERGLHRVDPAVDVVIGPKGNALRLVEGSLHLGRYHHDYVRGLTAMRTFEDGADPPRHVIALARFAHIPATQGPGARSPGARSPSAQHSGASSGRLAERSAARASGGRPVAVPPPGSTPVVGVDDAWWDRPADVFSPRLRTGERPRTPGQVALGATLARRTGLAPGDTVPLHADFSHAGEPVWTGEATVVGILQPTGTPIDHAAWVPIDTARQAYRNVVRHLGGRQYHEDLMTHLLVLLDPERPEQAAWLFDTFHTRRAEVVVHVDDLLDEVRALSRQGPASLGATLVLAIAILLLGLTLRARGEAGRLDRGLLRALGYGPLDRLVLTAGQGLVLVLTALALAFALEQVAMRFLAPHLPFAHLGATVTPGHLALWIGAPLTATLLGALAWPTPHGPRS